MHLRAQTARQGTILLLRALSHVHYVWLAHTLRWGLQLAVIVQQGHIQVQVRALVPTVQQEHIVVLWHHLRAHCALSANIRPLAAHPVLTVQLGHMQILLVQQYVQYVQQGRLPWRDLQAVLVVEKELIPNQVLLCVQVVQPVVIVL